MIERIGLILYLGQRTEHRFDHRLKDSQASRSPSLGERAIGDVDPGYLHDVGSQTTGTAQDMEDKRDHQIRSGELWLSATRLGPMLPPQLSQGWSADQVVKGTGEGAGYAEGGGLFRSHPKPSTGTEYRVQVVTIYYVDS